MLERAIISAGRPVALHTEGVDRNFDSICNITNMFSVALHTEGVDRNKHKLAFKV